MNSIPSISLSRIAQRFLAVALLVFGFSALISGQAYSQVPATLTPVSGSGQSTIVDTLFSNPLKVIVQDGLGNTLPNVPVTFTAPAGAPSATPTVVFNGAGNTFTVNSDASGAATVPAALVKASQKSSQYNVSVTASAASTTILLINAPGPSAAITVSQGAGQQGTILTNLPVAFTALVVDGFGNPVPGVGVTFTAPSSSASGSFSGSLTALTTTNATGLATASAFTLNAVAGVYNVTANTTASPLGTPANFNLINLPSTPSQIAVSQGSSQSTQVTTSFGTLLRAIVRDAQNNPVPDVDVTFTAPSSGATATFTGGFSTFTVKSDASGLATATTLTASAIAGSYSISATFSGGPSINFTMTNVPGAAASIAVQSGNNQSATITLNFTSTLSVIVTDAGGNVVPGVTVTFAAPGSGASGAFGGALTKTAVTNASGIATATTFTANSIAGFYSVTVTFASISTSFSLQNLNPSAISANTGSGQSATITTNYSTLMSALVTDAGGAGIPGLTVTFTAPSSGASGAFGGSLTKTAITNASGIATATAFTANATAGGYTVTASVTGVVTPASFNLTNNNPANIVVQGGNNQQATINTAFPARLTARVINSGGGGIAGLVVTFTASGSGASGTFGGSLTSTATTDINGDAQSAFFTANATVGGHTVNATVTGLVTPAAFNMANLTPVPVTVDASPAGGTPQAISINAAFTTALGVIVKDVNGVILSNYPVTFTVVPVGGAGAAFPGGQSSVNVNTNGSGIATAPTLTANGTAGTYTVTATAGSITFTFTLTNRAAASIATGAGTPQTTLIMTNFATQLQATVLDVSSNPVAGVTVTFTAPGSGASGAFGGSATTTAVTNASGVAVASTITANGTIGTYTVTAAVAGVVTPANFTLTNTAPASIAASAGATQTAVINTNFGIQLQATVLDASSAPVSGATVTFTAPSSGPSATFGGSVTTTAVTNASGIATAAVIKANGTTGVYAVNATVAGVAIPAAFNLTNTLATPVTAVASPSNGTPQSTAVSTAFATALGVLVKDSGGAIIVGIPVTFTVNGVGGASAGFTGGGTTATVNTNASGIATAPVLTANATAGTYTVTAMVGSLTVTFTLSNTAVPSAITVNAGNNQSATISTNFAVQLQAKVVDAVGNAVVGAVVVFAAPTTGAKATFAGASTATATTNASGVATAPIMLAGTVTGAYSITATVQGTAVTTAFSVSNTPGAASTITKVSGNNQSSALGADFAQPLVVVVKDASANVIPGASVTFNAPGAGARATFAGGLASATVTTDSAGNATSPLLTAVGSTGSYIVNAKVNNTNPTTNFTLTNTTAVPGAISLQAGSTQTTVVNTNFGTALQAKVTDTLGNPSSGVTVTFTVPSSGVSGTFAGSTTATAITNASGIATSPALKANTISGNFFAQATVAGVLSPVVYTLTNQPDTPVALSIVQGTPQSTIVITPFSTALVAQVRDVYNNPVPGASVTFLAPTVGSIAAFPGSANTVMVVADSTGKATAPTLTANSIAGTYTVTASIISGASVNYNLTNTPAPSSISATGGSTQSTLVTTAFGTQLQVTVKDASNFPVPGATVTFVVPGSGASAVLSATTVTTNASGVASVTATANTTIGTYNVTATVAGVSTPATFNLTNTVGAPATIAATGGSTQSTLVTTAFGASLQVTVKDSNNNPVSGVTVIFAAPASGSSAVLSAATATTNATGVASVTATANAIAGTYAVTASVAGVATTLSFNLTNTVGAPTSISATGGQTQSTLVTTAFGTSLQVTVKDGSNNPVSGVTVTFAAPASGSSAVLSAATATTNASGIASVTATANPTAGTYVVTGSVAGIATKANFNLTNTVGAPAAIAATGGQTQSTLVTTAFGTSLQVTVKDGSNNPVTGVTVTFAAPVSGSSAILSSTTAITNVSGIASVTATANATAGTYAVTASVSGIATTLSFNLSNTVGAPAAIAATGGSTQSTLVTTAFGSALQVTVKDSNNNPVLGVTVTFAAPGSGSTAVLSSATATTNAAGIASVTATANAIAGTYAVTASVTGVATTLNFNLTNLVGPPAVIAASGGSTQTTLVGTPFGTSLQVTVKDGSNNPVPGVTVTFTAPASGASAALSATAATTNAAGVATITVTANATVGTYAITALVAGIPTPIVFSLTNTGTPGLQLAVTASPTKINGPGQTITFTYSLLNTGNVSITSLSTTDTKIPGITCPSASLAVGVSMTCTATYIATMADITSGGVTSVAKAIGSTIAGTATSPTVTTMIGVDVESIRKRTVDANKELMESRARALTSMAPNAQRLHHRLTSWLFGSTEEEQPDQSADQSNSSDDRPPPLKVVGSPETANGSGAAQASIGGRLASVFGTRQPSARSNATSDAAGVAIGANRDVERAPGTSPFAFAGDAEDGSGRFNFAASLSQIRTAARSDDAAKLAAAAQTASADGLNLKGSSASGRGKHEDKFDIWVEGQASYYTNDRIDGRRQGNAAVLYAGVDAIVAPGIAVGVLMQRDWISDSSTTAGPNRDGAGWMAGPYIGMRLTKNIYFDARYAWGTAINHTNPLGSYTDTFSSVRELASARLTGDWSKGAWRFRPMMDVTYFNERQKTYVNQLGISIPETKVSLGRVTFGPEIAYRMELPGKAVFEPYIGIKGVYDFAKDNATSVSGASIAPDVFTGRLEAGASYQTPDGVSYRASGTYDGLASSGYRALQGQAFVILPLQ